MANFGEALSLLQKLFSISSYERMLEDPRAKKIVRIAEAGESVYTIAKKITVFKEHLDEQLSKIRDFEREHGSPVTSLFTRSTNDFANKQTIHNDIPNFSIASLRFFSATRSRIITLLKENKTNKYLPIEKLCVNNLIDDVNEMIENIYDYYRVAKRNEQPSITDEMLDVATVNMAKDNQIEPLDDSLKF
jgi:hypothetical protein